MNIKILEIPTPYGSNQLSSLLENLNHQKASGTLQIKAKVSGANKTRSRLLIYQNGEIVYGGLKLPTIEGLARKLVQKFKPDILNVALAFVKDKTTDKGSFREAIELLTSIRVLTWAQIEAFLRAQTVSTLEQVLSLPGEIQLHLATECHLSYGEDSHGFSWTSLQQSLKERQSQWEDLAPTITSMEAIPQLPSYGLGKVTQASVRQHLQRYVDGKNSLVDIAESLDKDPLVVARSYVNWAQLDWVNFDSDVPDEKQAQLKKLPIILSVDDSPIVQVTIKRIIGDRYNVLLADNAVDALTLLNQKEVALLLLDVTLPDIDGLEMCKTLRSIAKFAQLPIVMVTARDTFVDKLKGQIAGTNRYLTKPIDPDRLLSVIAEFVNK